MNLLLSSIPSNAFFILSSSHMHRIAEYKCIFAAFKICPGILIIDRMW